jgi:signal transduction histidine kinase
MKGWKLRLGLSIVAAIAKAHHADLAARPAAGGRLHIEVTFPLAGFVRPQAGGRQLNIGSV